LHHRVHRRMEVQLTILENTKQTKREPLKGKKRNKFN